MNDEGKADADRSLPTLARRDAVDRLGRGFSERITSSLDNTGKALTVLAGVGVFFFAAGYYVQWQRFKRGGLPSEEALALLPRGQIAAAGVKELFISLVFGGALLAIFGWGLVALVRATEGKRSGLRGAIGRLSSSELLFPTALIGVLNLLIVPWSKAGVIVAATLTLLFFFILFLVHRFLRGGPDARFPLWQLALAIGLAAVVLTGARLWEFTEPRPAAIVYLASGDPVKGTYVTSDSGSILMRVGATRTSPAQLIILRKDQVTRVHIWKSAYDFPKAPSLADKLAEALFGSSPEFSCISPECRIGGTRVGPSSVF